MPSGRSGPAPLDRLPDGADPPEPAAREDLDRVVVVGAGPVGMCSALALGRAGVPVTVLEKGERLATESRASTFHPPTLELLDDLGVLDDVMEQGLVAPRTQFRDRAKGPIAEFDLGRLADATPYPFRIQLEQNKLAAIVLRHIESEVAAGGIDVEVRFSWRAHRAWFVPAPVHPGPGPHTRTARLLCGTRHGFVEVSAPWVVACDGAHSPVRESLGIELLGDTYPERFLVASVSEELTDHIDDLAHVNYIADPEEWLVLLRTPDHWRVLLPVDASDAERADDDFDEADLQGRLAGVVDLGRPWRVIQWSLYVVRRAVAQRMRSGPFLLAGDAAHQNSPLGGMGMNSGIQDGVSAARRLAAVWHGRSDESVLDEYDLNRRRVATDHVQRDSHANWLALREPDPLRRAELQRDLAATAADPYRHRDKVARSAMLDAVRSSL